MEKGFEAQAHDAACMAMGEAVWELVAGGGASDAGEHCQQNSGSFRAS
ncbi:hypothetical protein [Candidatus Pantoea rara]